MQIEGEKLMFIMNFNVLYFLKFAPRMPQNAQSLVSTFNIFWGRVEGGLRGEGACVRTTPRD